MIDAFAASQGIPMDTVHCKAVFGKGMLKQLALFNVVCMRIDIEIQSFRYWYMNVEFVGFCYGISGFVDDVPVFLAKPQTYMNLSGESVSYFDNSEN